MQLYHTNVITQNMKHAKDKVQTTVIIIFLKARRLKVN